MYRMSFNIYEDVVCESEVVAVLNEHVNQDLTGLWAKYLLLYVSEQCDKCGSENLAINGMYMERHLGVPHEVEAWMCYQNCMSQCQEKECMWITIDNDMEGEPCGLCDKFFCRIHLYGDAHLSWKCGMYRNYCAKCWMEMYPLEVLPFPLAN